MTRTIISPGVELVEKDLSLIAPQNAATNVFIAGYASQGPTDEVVLISSPADLDTIYGPPTNSAERYFYHGIKELLNSPATIYASRLPYGSGSGSGFGSEYSALVYPVNTWSSTLSAVSTNLQITDGVYVLGEPVHVTLSEDQYLSLEAGTLFTWSTSGCSASAFGAVADLGKAGLIVLNKAQTTVNSQFEGFYVGIADNFNLNPATNFNAIVGMKTVSTSAAFVGNGTGTYTAIPNGTLQFKLSSTPMVGSSNSVSYTMENLTNFNIDGPYDDDLLNVGVFKIRKALYADQAYLLDYVLDGAIVGSIDSWRTAANQTGGSQVSFFLEAADTNDRNVEILVNPYMSNKYTASAMNSSGLPRKKVRVLTNELVYRNDPASSGLPTQAISALSANLGVADNLYPVGAYNDSQITTKDLGEIPAKFERALDAVRNDEIYDLDLVVEAGLGTIYTVTEILSTTYYDDTVFNATLSGALASLRTSNDLDSTGQDIRANYETIFGIMENFCNLPGNTGGRGDCMCIADPIRQLLVVGKNTKVLSDRNKNFQTDVYWAMRHQFELSNTSYAAVYANWAQVYDEFLGDKIWIPFSPVAAAAYARNDSMEFPWSAPAGYTRGLIGGNVVNIAITPNQKQRDELYKSNLNPVLYSPSQGMAIFGQKTLSRKPSAFDRVNVRRCFLALERPTKKAAFFFVFEPNTEFTRTRFVNTVKPIFEYAKRNGGIYDYLIVCDERNNTPQVIDSNEMRADFYIKPVRTAEYIILSFVATRSDSSFNEIVG